MKKLKAVPKQPPTSDPSPKPFPEVYSIYMNGHLGKDNLEELWGDPDLMIEALRWLQEVCLYQRQDPCIARDFPVPDMVYGTFVGLIANQLQQTTEVGRHLTHPRNLKGV